MTKYVIDAEAKEIYKPLKVQVNGAWVLSPSDEDLARAGIFPIDETKPEKVGVYFIPRGIEKRDGVWHRVYEEQPIVAPPPPVTRYSGWKMYKAIKAEGYVAAFNELMKNNIEVMIAFVRPQYFLSDDADFTAMVTQMCAALHIDDETKERILAASVDEEVR